MIGRIVEIAEDRRHLAVFRGFLVVNGTEAETWQELGRIPLDDIAALIANAYGMSYTNNLLVALAERGTPFVLCANNHNAVGMLLAVDGNYQQAKRYDAQIAASKPVRKQLWATLVKAKLTQQAALLTQLGHSSIPITALIGKVRSGDPDNREAQAARYYWLTLFGPDFRRDPQIEGINSLLNYGYTVLRAATARAVIAAGLHPTLGLHHRNEGNPMRLVDDLMEPFRPLIDWRVWQLAQEGKTEVTAETKRHLVRTLYADLSTDLGHSPACVCIQRLATSLAQLYIGEQDKLDLPLPGLPEDFQAD